MALYEAYHRGLYEASHILNINDGSQKQIKQGFQYSSVVVMILGVSVVGRLTVSFHLRRRFSHPQQR